MFDYSSAAILEVLCSQGVYFTIKTWTLEPQTTTAVSQISRTSVAEVPLWHQRCTRSSCHTLATPRPSRPSLTHASHTSQRQQEARAPSAPRRIHLLQYTSQQPRRLELLPRNTFCTWVCRKTERRQCCAPEKMRVEKFPLQSTLDRVT
jgi:hypothetical protein